MKISRKQLQWYNYFNYIIDYDNKYLNTLVFISINMKRKYLL